MCYVFSKLQIYLTGEYIQGFNYEMCVILGICESMLTVTFHFYYIVFYLVQVDETKTL